jgi:hypothetical protein
MKANPLLRAALFYALRLGWPVFPLKPKAKEPLTKHGFKDATTNEAQIRAWWAKWPNANVAIRTGEKFWVLDVDPRHGGDQSLMQLVAQHGALTDTLQQTTGGGGQQYLYEIPAHQKIGCLTKVWDGIDVRGEGGYIVCPPSIHPDTHKPYIWDGLTPITKQVIAPAPVWLLEELAKTKQPPNGAFALPEQIKHGEQHTTLFRMGCAMRHAGCEEAEIFEALWRLNQSRCERPGAQENIEKLARSICQQYPAGPHRAAWVPPAATITLTADAVEPTIDVVNAAALFRGSIRFKSFSRRGSMILGVTADDRQICWPTATDLMAFTKARAAILEGADVLLPHPPRNQTSKIWDPVVSMIVRLAAADAVRVETAVQAECRDLLRLMFRYARQPVARSSKDFMEYLAENKKAVRDRDAVAPPAVFCAEGFCWVHLPTWRNWLSLSTLTNRQYPLDDLRRGLFLLGFSYEKDVERGHDGDSERAALWRGPVDVLEE